LPVSAGDASEDFLVEELDVAVEIRIDLRKERWMNSTKNVRGNSLKRASWFMASP
jgi:hypothetical protein